MDEGAQGGVTSALAELALPAEQAEGSLAKATRAAVLRRDALYRRALALADVCSAAAAVVLAVGVLGDDELTFSLVAALPLVVLVSKTAGLYDRDENLLRKTTLDEAPAIFQVSTLYALLMLLLEGAFLE